MDGRCFAGCNKLQLKHSSSLADTRVAARGTEDSTLITAAAFQSLPPPTPLYNASDMLLALVKVTDVQSFTRSSADWK